MKKSNNPENHKAMQIISDWEVEHYELDLRYKQTILSKQPILSIKAKLNEMSEWHESNGIALFGGV